MKNDAIRAITPSHPQKSAISAITLPSHVMSRRWLFGWGWAADVA
jgi:hypothetical protein